MYCWLLTHCSTRREVKYIRFKLHIQHMTVIRFHHTDLHMCHCSVTSELLCWCWSNSVNSVTWIVWITVAIHASSAKTSYQSQSSTSLWFSIKIMPSKQCNLQPGIPSIVEITYFLSNLLVSCQFFYISLCHLLHQKKTKQFKAIKPWGSPMNPLLVAMKY